MSSPSTLQDQAEAFRSLHRPGQPVVLVNVWDVGSALTVVDAGAPAVATSSWAVAKSRGFSDGERTPFTTVLDLVAQLADRATVPITVDLETGYGRTPEEVGHSVRQVVAAGAVGCNLEDVDTDPTGSGLRDVTDQAMRLKAARSASDDAGVRIFINARTDVFLNNPSAGPAGLEEVLVRAVAYERAGADGLFAPGLQDVSLVAELVERCPLLVNVMAGSEDDLAALATAGVARISFGASPYVAAMGVLARQAQAVAQRAREE